MKFSVITLLYFSQKAFTRAFDALCHGTAALALVLPDIAETCLLFISAKCWQIGFISRSPTQANHLIACNFTVL